MKKVGKTTRPFSCDLDLFPYDYAVEVTNKFKELDLIDKVTEELWAEVSDQDHPQEKEMQEGKTAVWGGLTNTCEKKRSESKGVKERYTHLNAEFQRIARR